MEGIFILRWAKNVDGRRGSRKSSKKILEKWRMIGGRKEGGRDILRGGRPRHRARRACSPWKLLWLWTSYLFNHLATLNFFPPRIKFERKIGRRIRSRLNFHGYIFLDQSRFFCFSLHFNNKLIDWVFCLIKLSFCFVITRCIFVFLFHHNRACNIGRLNTK